MGLNSFAYSEKLREAKCIITSLSLHGAALATIVVAPNLLAFNEGTHSGKPVEVQIVSQGEQIVSPKTDLASNQLKPIAATVSPNPKIEIAATSPTDVVVPQRPKPLSKKVVVKKTPVPAKKESFVVPAPVVDVTDSKVEIPPMIEEHGESLPEAKPYEDLPIGKESEPVPLAEEDSKAKEVEPEKTPTKKQIVPVVSQVEPRPVEKPSTLASSAKPADKKANITSAAPTPTDQVGGVEKNATPVAPATAATQVAASGSDRPVGLPSGVKDVSQLQQAPGNVPPQYPELARRNRTQGATYLLYFVSAEGMVQNLKVVRSSGSPVLDDEALRAIAQYKFFPGQAGWTYQKVNFSLTGAAQVIPARLRTSSNTPTTTR